MNGEAPYPPRWSQTLNQEQTEAVTASGGPVLVVAGPGSGKTRVVTLRIQYLVEAMGIHPGRILAMTFTNKAAGEMKRRLKDSLGDEIRHLWIGTFHATCARLLRIHHLEADLPAGFTIIDEEDQLRILKTILRDPAIGTGAPKAASIRNAIEGAKRDGVRWKDFKGRGPQREMVKEIYRRYEEQLAAQGALDFNDLILRAVDLLKTAPGVLGKLQERFLHVLVDEFQDTDGLQYELVRLISAKHGSLFVVGDDDQSIYGWRGARVENMLDFRRDHPSCRVVKLQKNYRSTSRILKAAMAVIRCNEERTDKELWTDGPEGCAVRFVQAGDERGEARAIAREVKDVVSSGGRLGAVAVIYRIHAQSRAIEEALIEAAIPYRIVGGVRFYERMEVKDLLAYLKLAFNPRDDLSFARVLNVPPRGFGEETLRRIRQAAESAGASLLEGASAAVKDRLLPPRRLEDLARFTAMIEEHHRLSSSLTPSQLLAKIITTLSYEDYLKAGFPEAAETRIENVRELVGLVEEFEETSDEPSLALLFDRIALQTSVDTMDTKEDRVTLMTAHSAKGLEFDGVIVAGVEDGLFPYRFFGSYDLPPAQVRKEMEEECRLLYVAMTRARERLLLTAARSRRLYDGSGSYRSESPFIIEASPAVISRSDVSDDDEEPIAGVKEEAGAREEDDGLKVGDRVLHQKYGPGQVLKVTPGDIDKITVKFGKGRVKLIVATFLERI